MTTNEYLTSKYGLRMTVLEVAIELKMKPKTIISNRSAGKFHIPFFRDGRSIFAPTEAVGRHIDEKNASAK